MSTNPRITIQSSPDPMPVEAYHTTEIEAFLGVPESKTQGQRQTPLDPRMT